MVGYFICRLPLTTSDSEEGGLTTASIPANDFKPLFISPPAGARHLFLFFLNILLSLLILLLFRLFVSFVRLSVISLSTLLTEFHCSISVSWFETTELESL